MLRSITTILFCTFTCLAFGQNMANLSWKKKKKIAEGFYAIGDFTSAGQYYQSAWKSKTSEPELTYMAGVSFMNVRDYPSAVQSFQPIQGNNDAFKDAGYLYGISLKFTGQYKDAIAAFTSHINGYSGEDLNDFKFKTEQQIKGCKLGMSWLTDNEQSEKIILKHLGTGVNSTDVEFCPRSIKEDKILFSSVTNGIVKIYQSELVGDKWSKRKSFPIRELDMPHYGNGSFTPDGKQFYFTQCNINSKMETHCAVFVTKKKVNTFSTPIKLSEKINAPRSTNTHPFIYQDGEMEVLIFTSDRIGGEGGMDLWYSMKKTDAPYSEFSEPENLGTKINSPEDEVTPYYDLDSRILYFSSNGHVSVGGHDIFKCEGRRTSWGKPINLGPVYNSSTDDLYFTLVPGTKNGLFVSNRLVAPDKQETNDDDIFSINVVAPNVIVNGYITNASNSDEILDEVNVTLYQILKDGSLIAMGTKSFGDGNYEFKLQPNKNYRIEAQRDGFMNSFFDMKTYTVSESIKITQDIPLENMVTVAVKEKELEKPNLSPADIAAIIPDGDIPIPDIKLSDVEALNEIEELEETDLETIPITTEAQLPDYPEIEPKPETIIIEQPLLDDIEEIDIETPVVTEEQLPDSPEVESEPETIIIEQPLLDIEEIDIETPVVTEEQLPDYPEVESEPETVIIEQPLLDIEKSDIETPVVTEEQLPDYPKVESEPETVIIEQPLLDIEEIDIETPVVTEAQLPDYPKVEPEPETIIVEQPLLDIEKSDIETPVVTEEQLPDYPKVESEPETVIIEQPLLDIEETDIETIPITTEAQLPDYPEVEPEPETIIVEQPLLDIEETDIETIPITTEAQLPDYPEVEPEPETIIVEQPLLDIEEIDIEKIEIDDSKLEVEGFKPKLSEIEATIPSTEIKESSIVISRIEDPVINTKVSPYVPESTITYTSSQSAVSYNMYFTGEIDSRIYDYPSNTKVSSSYVPEPTMTYTSSPQSTVSQSTVSNNMYFTGEIDSRIYDYPGNAKADLGSSSYISSSSVSNTSVSSGVYVTDNNNPVSYSYNETSPTTITSSGVITYDATPLIVEYKIQIAAVFEYSPERYNPVESLGRGIALEEVETEAGTLTRVLIDGFKSATEARDHLTLVQTSGFPRAFMILYDNGVRIPSTMRR